MGRVLFPNIAGLLGRAGYDILLTVFNHLVGDLNKKSSHLVGSVVKPSDGVDHFDSVYKGRQGLNYLLGSAIVQRVDKFLKSRKILHIVLGLIKFVGEGQIKPVEVYYQFVYVFLDLIFCYRRCPWTA